ncbi:zinc-dependent metalloprotease [Myxococcota bacterium]|nr:zinc-dependent metalloprotease [Myxococcota bacterium]
MRAKLNHTTRGLAALAVSFLAGACAEPVGDINTVQPGYLSKSLFENEWYYRQTIVESDPGTGLSGAFVGLEADIEKIRWEIREDKLIAYRTHEGVPGIDEDRTLPGSDYKGDPVASFEVQSHFDIERRYNTSTGEQTNVIGENKSDRPWNEREYFRIKVDTAVGGAADFGEFLNFVGGFVGAETRYGLDTAYRFSPHQPVIEPGYIELTNRRVVGDDYTCGYLYGEWGCASSDVRVRHSFWQIDHVESARFEPTRYDDLIPHTDDDGKPLKTMFLPVPLKRFGSNDPSRSCDERTACPDGLTCEEGLCVCVDANCQCAADSNCADGLTCVEGLCRGCTDSSACSFGNACRDGVCQPNCFADAECTENEACIRTFDDAQAGRPGECSVPFAEVACNEDLFTALDNYFAPGYYSERDCDTSSFSQFERHGLFRTERPGYDRQTGAGRDEQRQYFVNIHPIWQTAYEFETETGDDGKPAIALDPDGKPIRIAGADGQPKPIPMAERKPRPIVYYLNIDFPEDLKAETLRVAKDWDAAMMEAARAGTGREEAALRAELATFSSAQPGRHYFIEGDTLQHKGMYQIRENNCGIRGVLDYLGDHPTFYPHVEAALKADENKPATEFLTGDEPTDFDDAAQKRLRAELKPGNLHRVCAALKRATVDAGEKDYFQYQKVGDVRFSFLNWVNEQQPDGPLGYGPSGTDGENGRIISANANIYGAALDNYARNAVDTVRAINGDLALSDLLQGKNVADWLERSQAAEMQTAGQGLSAATIAKAEGRRQKVRTQMGLEPAAIQPGKAIDPRAMSAEFKAVQALAKPAPLERAARSEGQARLDRAMQDPDFAALMVPKELEQLLAPVFNAGEPADRPSPALKQAATEAATDLRAFAERIEKRNAWLGNHRIDTFEMIDDAVIGLALELKDRDPEELFQLLRREIYRGVTLHEIGHTMGLTHNFEGSIDALNYQDEYWKKMGDIPPGDNDDNGIDDRAEARVPEFTYSTIMDYHGRFNSDTKGLGKYDHAAMKAAYARKIEVFDDNVKLPAIPGIGLYVAYVYGADAVPSLLNDDLKALTARKDVAVEEVVRDRSKGIQANTAAIIDSIGNPDVEIHVARDVPYAYCEHAYLFRSRCKMFDQGSSNHEVVHNSISRYWNYYFFNNFRRGRMETGFINGFMGRQAGLLDDLTYAVRYYVYGNQTSAIGRDYLKAALESLNFISRVMGTPVPGRHCLDATRGVFVPEAGQACEQYVDVPEGLGRDQFLRYDDQYLYNIDYIGTFFDKSAFLQFLLDDSTNFFNVTDFGDSRRFSINYYRLFRPELVKMARDMLFSYLGLGGLTKTGLVVDDEGRVKADNLVDPQTWGFEAEPGESTDEASPTEMPLRVDAQVPPALLWRTLALSAIYNSSSFDGETDFRDYIMVFEEGSGEARDLPEDTPVVRYLDPITRVSYVAPQVVDGESISVALLTHFNEKAAELAALEEQDPTEPADLTRLEQLRAQLGHFSDLISQFRMFRRVSEPYDD